MVYLDEKIKSKIEEALEDINMEYGQDFPVRINKKSYDYENLHFEFSEIFGIVCWKRENGEYMTFVIEEDDDFWFIPEDNSYFASCWLSCLENVAKRMRKYIIEQKKKTYRG